MEPWVHAPEDDNATGIGVGIWLQDHAIEKAEDGGIHPDPEREARNRHARESAFLDESANGVAEILEKHERLYGPHASRVRFPGSGGRSSQRGAPGSRPSGRELGSEDRETLGSWD